MNCFQISASASYLHLLAKTLPIERASLEFIPHLMFKNANFTLDMNLCKLEIFLKSEKNMEVDNPSMILLKCISSNLVIEIILYLNIHLKRRIHFVIIIIAGIYASVFAFHFLM